MPSRLKLVVAYDGAPFAGWQSQRNGQAVQDHLERAFRHILGGPVRVHGAGRTDAGVHALAQTAHVDLPDRSLDGSQWPAALNGTLSPSIRVLRCRYVTPAFHARFSAQGKLYRYRIWNDRILPPFEAGRAWHVSAPLQLEAMATEAQAFVGRHDFASFAANRGRPERETVRTIDAVQVRKNGHCLTIAFSGDGFLYRMVRLMVGALVRRGRGQGEAGEIRARLLDPTRALAAARFAAPAAGLFLIRVRY
ncbi:MAG TPA: tRNA pseudouridine(38-40) synthase TruA [Chthoniobacterales bacterium]|nr:tRNA pseudouridine(38-40) synthase TruA [Chthoniobacterales bacterium]